MASASTYTTKVNTADDATRLTGTLTCDSAGAGSSRRGDPLGPVGKVRVWLRAGRICFSVA